MKESISLRSFSSIKIKTNRTLLIRSKITRENMKSDKNMEICTKRYKRQVVKLKYKRLDNNRTFFFTKGNIKYSALEN